MKKEGLYISLLPDGKIKRHLSSDFGEMPLPDTTIAEELITLTEYDDTSITNELGKIHTLSHQVEEDITSQLPFRQRYGNFLMRLREESPMWYTLLMTQFCDEVRKTPFADWNEKQIAYFMVDGLYQPRGAEITVNIALSSLCEHDPEDFCDLNVREDIIHQSTATVFFTLNETLDAQYLFRSAEQYYIFLLQHFYMSNPKIAQCQHCGRYFIPKTRKRTLYCDYIVRDGKTCKEIAPYLTYKRKAASSRIISEFLRIKRMLVRRVDRALGDKKASLIDMSYDQYRDWLRSATDARNRYLAEKLTEEEAMAIIYVPKKDELIENNSAELTLVNSCT